jgi:hypothetical protein
MNVKIYLYSLSLISLSVLHAQTTAIGTFKNILGNGTAIKAHTDSALGVGTALPEGKAEIRYCPPVGTEHTGLLVTRVYCHGISGTTLGGGGSLGDGLQGGGLTDGNTTGETGVANGSVVQVPHYYSPILPVGMPIQNINNNAAPLLWVKTQQVPFGPGSSANNESRLLVLPDGRTGINVANPRAALDVRGFGPNAPAAIFGVRAQRSPFTIAGNPVPQQYTKHVEIVPHLSRYGYNRISQEKDLGIFFTDGLGNMGTNVDGALVIAPWSDTAAAGSNVGGLRMDKSGNTELRGNFRCTRLTVNAKWWPDAVFADNYRLMPLSEVASFIKTNRHLPGIPSEKAVLENGQDVGALQVLQQQKIEELTLYAIEQDKKLKEQEIAIEEQKKQMAAQEDRLQKLEKLLKQK